MEESDDERPDVVVDTAIAVVVAAIVLRLPPLGALGILLLRGRGGGDGGTVAVRPSHMGHEGPADLVERVSSLMEDQERGSDRCEEGRPREVPEIFGIRRGGRRRRLVGGHGAGRRLLVERSTDSYVLYV